MIKNHYLLLFLCICTSISTSQNSSLAATCCILYSIISLSHAELGFSCFSKPNFLLFEFMFYLKITSRLFRMIHFHHYVFLFSPASQLIRASTQFCFSECPTSARLVHDCSSIGSNDHVCWVSILSLQTVRPEASPCGTGYTRVHPSGHRGPPSAS